jgi:hypothetical protein
VTILDCHPENPFRAVDWRFRLAEAILSGQLPFPRRGLDLWVKRALRFLGDRVASQGDDSIGQSGRLDPAILGAFEIRFSAEPRLRSVLEARVLAGQTAQAIAELCGIDADVVEAFERLHYDLRDRLGAGDFIRATAFGIEPPDGIPDADTLMKTFAYGFGRFGLDSLLAVLDAGESPGSGARGAVTGDEKLVRMAILARSLTVNSKTAPGLLRLLARLLEFERGTAADVVINRPVRATVEPWPTRANGGGFVRSVRAISVDLGTATLAEPLREGPGDRAGAVTVTFPEPDQFESLTPSRRTA